MAFETAETFSPSVENKYSGATGLIQFMPETAQQLGTSTAELAQMTPETQLSYVAAYFAPFRGRLASVEDVYMAILWPRAVGKPADEPLFVEGGPQYAQNFYLDLDGDGTVTKQEASSHVTTKLEKGQRAEYMLAPVG
jgi:hypothetical protein